MDQRLPETSPWSCRQNRGLTWYSFFLFKEQLKRLSQGALLAVLTKTKFKRFWELDLCVGTVGKSFPSDKSPICSALQYNQIYVSTIVTYPTCIYHNGAKKWLPTLHRLDGYLHLTLSALPPWHIYVKILKPWRHAFKLTIVANYSTYSDEKLN